MTAAQKSVVCIKDKNLMSGMVDEIIKDNIKNGIKNITLDSPLNPGINKSHSFNFDADDCVKDIRFNQNNQTNVKNGNLNGVVAINLNNVKKDENDGSILKKIIKIKKNENEKRNRNSPNSTNSPTSPNSSNSPTSPNSSNSLKQLPILSKKSISIHNENNQNKNPSFQKVFEQDNFNDENDMNNKVMNSMKGNLSGNNDNNNNDNDNDNNNNNENNNLIPSNYAEKDLSKEDVETVLSELKVRPDALRDSSTDFRPVYSCIRPIVCHKSNTPFYAQCSTAKLGYCTWCRQLRRGNQKQGSICLNCGERLTAKYHRWYPNLVRLEPLEKTRTRSTYKRYKPVFEHYGITWKTERQFEFVLNHYMIMKIYVSTENFAIEPLHYERIYMIGVFAGREFNTGALARKLLREGCKLAMFRADFPDYYDFLRDERAAVAEQMNSKFFQGWNKCYFHAHYTNIEGWYNPNIISKENIVESFKELCDTILARTALEHIKSNPNNPRSKISKNKSVNFNHTYKHKRNGAQFPKIINNNDKNNIRINRNYNNRNNNRNNNRSNKRNNDNNFTNFNNMCISQMNSVSHLNMNGIGNNRLINLNANNNDAVNNSDTMNNSNSNNNNNNNHNNNKIGVGFLTVNNMPQLNSLNSMVGMNQFHNLPLNSTPNIQMGINMNGSTTTQQLNQFHINNNNIRKNNLLKNFNLVHTIHNNNTNNIESNLSKNKPVFLLNNNSTNLSVFHGTNTPFDLKTPPQTPLNNFNGNNISTKNLKLTKLVKSIPQLSGIHLQPLVNNQKNNLYYNEQAPLNFVPSHHYTSSRN